MGRLTRTECVSREVLAWGAATLRDLPWRANREPWPVLVSEVMLQQTPVSRALPRWPGFIAAFPTPASLASAPLADALVLWQGLGYPRRCRNLRGAATAIVERHGGEVPGDLGALLALPGVGPYTARAVLAFSFRADVAAIDTNVSRVLSRVENAPMGARALQELADSMLPQSMAWEWNQSMMDLGSRVCTARTPACGECPLAELCAWRGEGPDPARSSAGAPRRQARFEGSDRQLRGRAMRALVEGPVPRVHLVSVMAGDDTERASRLVDDLVAEGLALDTGGLISLP